MQVGQVTYNTMERAKAKKIFFFSAMALFLITAAKKGGGIKIEDWYSNWNLIRSTVDEYDTRNLNQIEQIVVHHSASLNQTADDFANYHVLTRGWPGIGYHFVIEKDGTIIQGNPLENISYNTQNQNTKTVAICLSGNFDLEQPTGEQMDSLAKLISHLRGELPQSLEVYGHRDFAATSCPGDNLYNQLYQFKLAA